MQQEQEPNKKQDLKTQKLTSEEKKRLSNMAKFLSRGFVQTQTFGLEHPLAKQAIEQCFALLSNLIKEKGEIVLYIAGKKLKYGNTVLEEKNLVVDKMIDLFTTVQLVSLGFEKGFSRRDFLKLLSIFTAKPEDILASGGIEKLVKEKKVESLKLNPIRYELIGMHEKVVPEETQIAEGVSAHRERQLTEKKAKPEEKVKKEKAEGKLLSLIDSSLKEGVEQSLFVDKLTQNPLEVVNLITDAIRLTNEAGGENANAILSSIINKLALVGDDLYRCLTEGKEDEATKDTYKAAGTLGKELTKRIKYLRVSPELNNLVKEMTNVLTVFLDQIEAQKILSTFFKGKMTEGKQTKLLRKIAQREKSSPEFRLLMKRLLFLKGMPKEKVTHLIDEKGKALEKAEREKETALTQNLTLALQKFKHEQMSMEEVLAKLKEILTKRLSK